MINTLQCQKAPQKEKSPSVLGYLHVHIGFIAFFWFLVTSRQSIKSSIIVGKVIKTQLFQGYDMRGFDLF